LLQRRRALALKGLALGGEDGRQALFIRCLCLVVHGGLLPQQQLPPIKV
jgi:hypothetical protein